jgi:hypothetical protein
MRRNPPIIPFTPYMQNLHDNHEQFQVVIDDLLQKYKVQPAGDGYIDLILDCKSSLQLIDELAKQAIAIETLTWWCNCTPESELKFGCPHGMGGPTNKFGDGWFSECDHYPDFVVAEQQSSLDEASMEPDIFADECAKLVINYIEKKLPDERFYSPCLHPGLWIYIPDYWQRKYYWI